MYDLDTAALPPQKSTNVRPFTMRIPPFIRLPFQLVSHVSPRLAGDIGRRIFFHPARLAYSEAQRKALDGADRANLTVMGRTIAAYGWGEGPVILLVHGWAGHAGQMIDLVGPLVARGFRVMAIDMPAHGRSEGSLSSLIHFANAILAARGQYGPIHGVVTHSLGAAGLIRAVLGGLSIEKVVMMAPQSQFHDIWRAFRNGMGMSETVWAEMVEISERWLGVPFAEVHPTFGAPKMTAAALVLHGLNDRVTPAIEGSRLASLWPGARLETLEAGHRSILTDERAIQRAAEFFQT
ncbi:MAG: alpha/beta fold hydrolase [Rhodomicrobiaceae bacterium]